MELIKTFNYNDSSYNVIILSDPFEPLFKCNDIANIIEITRLRSFLKIFDETEKIQKKIITPGGTQKCLFLTQKAITIILEKYTKPIIEHLKKWIIETIQDIRLEYLKDENSSLMQKIKNKEDIEIDEDETVHYIYIYITDTRNDIPDLKIGYTKNIKKRISTYSTVCTHGKCELCEEVPHVDIKIVESYIHALLHNYNIKREVFQLDVEKAKLIVLNIINLIKIVFIGNDTEMKIKLLENYKDQSKILKKTTTCTIGTQTDFEENDLQLSIKDKDAQPTPSKFDEFIEKYCIVRPDVEVNCKDIIGQHRLWSRNTKKEVTTAFKDYLDTRFKYTRLRNQGKDQSVYGYTGVTLIEIEHKRSLNPTDLEMFVFEKCVFSQGGTILKSTLVENYIDWKKNVGKEITNDEETSIINYFKNGQYNEHVLYSTVWTKEGSGQGYYGLILKSDIKYYKKPSTTSKQVFKRLLKTKFLLTKWDTIAKAAESENVSNAKMSRYIKNKTEVDDYYYTLE